MGFEKFQIFARNPWVLAYRFTENCQFGAKTDRNSIFLGRDPRIANWLSIMVPYFNFTGFEKIHIFARNPWVLAYGFTENCQFGAKTDRNYVFLGRDPHIANRLSIMVPYFNFMGSEKFHIFARNLKCYATVLPKIASLGQKLIQTPYFLVVTPVLRIGYL
jgi:hypothetical protein